MHAADDNVLGCPTRRRRGIRPSTTCCVTCRVTTELVTAERAISLAPVPDSARNAAGAASLGFLVAVVDTNAAPLALVAGQPDWTATADLALHATGWLTEGPVLVDSRLERGLEHRGHHDTTLRRPRGRGARRARARGTPRCEPANVARLPHVCAHPDARASVAAGRFDPTALVGQRRQVSPAAPPAPEPLMERIGLRVVDATRGVVELHNHDYVRNSFGTINGGVLGFVFQGAAEAAIPGLVATDVHIHYLAQAKAGPRVRRSRSSDT